MFFVSGITNDKRSKRRREFNISLHHNINVFLSAGSNHPPSTGTNFTSSRVLSVSPDRLSITQTLKVRSGFDSDRFLGSGGYGGGGGGGGYGGRGGDRRSSGYDRRDDGG